MCVVAACCLLTSMSLPTPAPLPPPATPAADDARPVEKKKPRGKFHGKRLVYLESFIPEYERRSQAKTKAAGLTRHQLAMMALGVPAISLGTLAIVWRKSLKESPHFTTWHGVSHGSVIDSISNATFVCPDVGPPSRPSASSR